MSLDLIRKQSNETASRLGYSTNSALPLLDEVQNVRTNDESVKRLLCLNAVAACAYGFDKHKAVDWLRQEGAFDEMATSERRFIENSEGDPIRFQVQVEGLWALAWALGLVPQLDFGEDCDDNFVMLMPNLRNGETSDVLRSKIVPRTTAEILAACDLAYCLHWAIREALLTGGKLPGDVQLYVIEERRRVLEWLIGEE
jgi:hypothetical protein